MTAPAEPNYSICQPWTTPEAAAECCPDLATTDLTQMEEHILNASDLLYQLSGRRYSGLCETTVRPCGTGGCFRHFGAGVLSPGIIGYDWSSGYPFWNGGGWWYGNQPVCGCRALSQIELAGYPVREILEVTIDGATIDPAGYRLDRGRYLVRLDAPDGTPQRWPHCQNLAIDDGPGTFFVTYLHGAEPPPSGAPAADQLACELAKACGGSGECELPAGTVRMTRLGLTVDIEAVGVWLLGSQRTGLASVDAFLSVYRSSRRSPTVVSSPDIDPFPLPVP